MIKIENADVYGWEAAIRGARNPMNSWDKADTRYFSEGDPILGPNDHKLLRNLANAGPDHGKFLRMITVSVDLTAPLYWWKEFDTYKVGTVANSCSTMHKIHAKEFRMSDFSHEHIGSVPNCDPAYYNTFEGLIETLNEARRCYLETMDKCFWWQLIQLLPTSYNQRRTVSLNYAVLKSMYHARKHHKLDEWRDFCAFIETLPYSELIIGGNTDA
jgi:hypothetical protein